MKALILTAGLGTRFRPQTEEQAKPALPFLNVPLMGYSLFHLESLELTDLALNLHHLPDTVRAAAASLTSGRKYKLHFSDETHGILGSGGGIRHAEKFLRGSGNFLVCNGDEVLFFKQSEGFKKFFAEHTASGAIATLLTTDHPEVGTHLKGLRVDQNQNITEFSVKEKGLAHFTGVFAFSDRVFDYMPKSGDFHIFKDVLTRAIERGEKVKAHHVKDMLWLETGDEAGYIASTATALKELTNKGPYAAQILKALDRFGAKPKETEPGIWLSEGAEFRGEPLSSTIIFLGRNAKILENSQVKTFAVLGPSASFDNGVIDAAVIAPNVHIHEMVSIKKQLVL